jgi:hypothetical protein
MREIVRQHSLAAALTRAAERDNGMRRDAFELVMASVPAMARMC